MANTEKLKPKEVEEQLVKLKTLIETEPAPPSLEGQLYSDTEICGLIASMLLNAHQQRNYSYLKDNDKTISELEQDPTWSHPDLKRKISHLRAMHTLVSNNTQARGCLFVLMLGICCVWRVLVG